MFRGNGQMSLTLRIECVYAITHMLRICDTLAVALHHDRGPPEAAISLSKIMPSIPHPFKILSFFTRGECLRIHKLEDKFCGEDILAL